MADIINIQHYTEALRNTGYKNTESALAEIIDNSVEAKATCILIICKNSIVRGRKVVTEIAILDNGIGMDERTLSGCLSIGESTRRDRKGMGRFGVGLPQASLHVSPHVEVYSWQKAKNIKKVFLDIRTVKSGETSEISSPVSAEIPTDYQAYLARKDFKGHDIDFRNSGTLVIWKVCDRLKPSMVSHLFKRFQELLGRKFRHFINEGCLIGLSVPDERHQEVALLPNDPLYLMKNNYVLGDPENPTNLKSDGEPIFELWENKGVLGEVTVPIKYRTPSGTEGISSVDIRFSVAKLKYLETGGESKIGKETKKNVGISIVRANREIDFGKFDFFEEVNEPQHRWWGCEVRFQPELDEVFGVASNKQQVELFALDPLDYEDEEIPPLWFTLSKIISPEIKQMFNFNKGRRKGSRSAKKTELVGQPEEVLINALESTSKVVTASKAELSKISKGELQNRIREKLIDGGNPTPTLDEIGFASKQVVRIEHKDLGDTSSFIDVSPRMGNCWLTINTGSVFYRELYSRVEEIDPEAGKALRLLLMAFARAEDESFSDPQLYNAFKDVRDLWGRKLRRYLQADFKS